MIQILMYRIQTIQAFTSNSKADIGGITFLFFPHFLISLLVL